MSSPSPGKRRMDTDVVKLYPLLPHTSIVAQRRYISAILVAGMALTGCPRGLGSLRLRLLCICDPKYIYAEGVFLGGYNFNTDRSVDLSTGKF